MAFKWHSLEPSLHSFTSKQNSLDLESAWEKVKLDNLIVLKTYIKWPKKNIKCNTLLPVQFLPLPKNPG